MKVNAGDPFRGLSEHKNWHSDYEKFDDLVDMIERPPITITFDRNVFEYILDPEKVVRGEIVGEPFGEIRELIQEGRITPFISETAFTLETLPARDDSRMNVLTTRTFAPITDTSDIPLHLISHHPGSSTFDKNYLTRAQGLGFKLLPNYRFGRVQNPDISPEFRYLGHEENAWLITEKFGEVLNLIESNGGGFDCLKRLLGVPDVSKHPWTNYAAGFKDLKKFNKCVSEWCDGDSVAIHIAYGLDHFCSFDRAKNSGGNSVFGHKILSQLTDKYGFSVKTPSEILLLLT